MLIFFPNLHGKKETFMYIYLSGTALICGFPLGGEGDKTISGFFPNVGKLESNLMWI